MYFDLGDYEGGAAISARWPSGRNPLGPEHLTSRLLSAISRTFTSQLATRKRRRSINDSGHPGEIARPGTPQRRVSVHGLANLHADLGDYAKAEPLYHRALAIREKSHEHASVANILNTLANLYTNLGDYTKAESLQQRALAIREKSLGLEHPDVAVSLNNLALAKSEMGDYAKAEPLYQRAGHLGEFLRPREFHSRSYSQQSQNLTALWATTRRGVALSTRSGNLGEIARAEHLIVANS